MMPRLASPTAAAAVLLTSAVVLAGCTGDSQSDPTSGTGSPSESQTGSPDADAEGAAAIDACSLLTVEQVADATGSDAEPGRSGSPSAGTGSLCEWTTSVDEVSFVQLAVLDSTAQDSRAELEEFLGQEAEDADIDAALDGFVVSGIAGAQSGALYLEVSLVPEDNDAAVALVEQASSRLG